ncbi:MAG: SDR family oxidoreductase [Chitinophagaceae bacterium]
MNSVQNSYGERNSLDGKTVVITGASSGVGRAAALEFARNGARLVLAARRLNALEELVKECQEMGAPAMAVYTDVTDPLAMIQLAESAYEFGGWIDVWINNAGVMAAGGFTDTPVEVHDQVIKINLMGFIHGAHAVLPYFKRQNSGILINNISIGGFYPTPYAVGYSASKFGLRGFSEALKAELTGSPGIHICDLYPAFLDTPGIQHAGNYTGYLLKPAPPVYDPQKVGRAMVQLARRPRNSLTVGGVAHILRMGYFFMPGIMRFITAKVMEAYFKQAVPTPATSGNLFEPIEYGTSIHGGWDKAPDRRKRKRKAAFFIGGLAVSYFLIKQLRSNK